MSTETLPISKLARQSGEVSRRVRDGESFVVTRGHQLLGVLRPIPAEMLERLEEMLHLNSPEFSEAVSELREGLARKNHVTEVFTRQVRGTVRACAGVKEQVARAVEMLQASRNAGTLVHPADAAPTLLPQLRGLRGKIRKLTLACDAESADGPAIILYYFASDRDGVVLLTAFLRRQAADMGAAGLAKIADAMAGPVGEGRGRGHGKSRE